jgi:putative inner membrane protein
LKQVIAKMLVENEYIDSIRATKLNPVWLQPVLEIAIRENGDEIALPAFNCFS